MAELTVNVVALIAPNLTAETPVKFVPVMTTEVLPAVVPEDGEIEVTVGGRTGAVQLKLMFTLLFFGEIFNPLRLP